MYIVAVEVAKRIGCIPQDTLVLSYAPSTTMEEMNYLDSARRIG